MYLKGLHGIRAISAIIVLISHVKFNGVESQLLKSDFLNLTVKGGAAVSCFFTLSGFLISYLLFVELDKSKTINLKKFYLRRILRIWPLYFIYIFLSLIISTLVFHESISPNIWYYFAFIPNVLLMFHETISWFSHYWSLGAEEQFYLFWPLLLLATRKPIINILTFVFVFSIVKLILNIFWGNGMYYEFMYMNKFDSMAIGGVLAYMYKNHTEKLKIIINPFIELASLIIIFMFFFNKFHIFSFLDSYILTFATCILIINGIMGINHFINLESKFFVFIGTISFGVYVYHVGIILILEKYISNGYYVLILAFPITVIISWLSFNYFEKPFLKIKDKYSVH